METPPPVRGASSTTSKQPYHRYPYASLTEQYEIRLITLATPLSAQHMRCSIRHATLSFADYDALSYVWNEPSMPGSPMPIHCDENTFMVTPNLFNALQTIWTAFPERSLWADQICVNQDSDLEKNHQVAAMSAIYGGANTVHVWLGAPAKPYPNFYFSRWLPSSERLDNDDHWTEISNESRWAEDLHNRAWFHRIWTLQEIIMAKHAQVWCGSQHADWDEFVDNHEKMAAKLKPGGSHKPVLSNLRNLRMQRKESLFPTLVESVTRRRNDTLEHCGERSSSRWGLPDTSRDPNAWRSSGKRTLTLSELMSMSQDRHATDPRDKVFALLGLMHKPCCLAADYTMKEADVAMIATKHCIEHEKDLRMLNTAGTWYSGEKQMPTWVRNLERERRRRPGLLVLSPKNQDQLDWPAAAPQAEVSNHPEQACLAIGGVVLGSVYEMGQWMEDPRRDKYFQSVRHNQVATLDILADVRNDC